MLTDAKGIAAKPNKYSRQDSPGRGTRTARNKTLHKHKHRETERERERDRDRQARTHRHGNWLADMQGWLPEMQNGCPRCKTISLLACVQPTCQTAGRHAGVAARDAKKNHVLPRTTTYDHVLPRTTTYYHVLSRTTTSVVFASRAATLACRPASSRSLLLNCYLLIYCRTSTY